MQFSFFTSHFSLAGNRFLSFYRSTLGQALTGALLYWAALPPLDLWPLGWLAPIWWIALIRRTELSGKRPYRALWLVGFVFWLAAIHWLRLPHPATSIGWLTLAGYLGFYLPVFVGLGRVAVHRLRVPVILAAPVIWAGLELARAHLLTGITMAALAHTQYRWITLIQISDLCGGYTVDFLMMFVAACLGRMLPVDGRRFALWPAIPLAAILAAALAYGYVRTSGDPPEPEARIALVQGSVDITLQHAPGREREIYEQYMRLSREALSRARAEGKPLDLIVWPETMFPGVLVTFEPGAEVPAEWQGTPEQFEQALQAEAVKTHVPLVQTARALGTPLVLGVDIEHWGPDGTKLFNAATFMTPRGEVAGQYAKMHLVLFGEYVPLTEYLPWLKELTPLPSLATPGRNPEAFDLDLPAPASRPLRLAPNICYETVIPHVIRQQVQTLIREGREPDVLVNLSNDGWFWGSSELDMHLVCGVFRAIECRKPLVIAANTGFSAWIDGDGRIRAKGPRRECAVLLAEVGRDPRHSLYLVCGDIPVAICLTLTLALAAVALRDRRRRQSR